MIEEVQIFEKNWRIPLATVVGAIIVSGAIVYGNNADPFLDLKSLSIENQVLPRNGVELPIVWGNLGGKLLQFGVIDEERLKTVYGQRELPNEMKKLLSSNNTDKLKITRDNAGVLLNLFWALGLSSKNSILETGEMIDKRYGGTKNFASTGGWTIAKGTAMDHYSKHEYFNLSPDKQALVEEISGGIYRPCCGNSTHFPDCNHGMAMLGLLELLAAQGVSEEEMWQAALAVNSFWFPENYTNIARYKLEQGIDWSEVNPREVLGAKYSSASGYAKIASIVKSTGKVTGGCEVGANKKVPASNCGI